MATRESSSLAGAGLLGATVACSGPVPATIHADVTGPAGSPEPERRWTEREPKPAATGDRTPPQIVRVEFESSSRLRIYFSEPVVVAAGFDPGDFRISLLYSYAEGSYADYYDPAYQRSGAETRLSWARGGDDWLELELEPALDSVVCNPRAYGRYGSDFEQDLFLHYAAGKVPIADASGNALANFGADWVALGRTEPPTLRTELDPEAAPGAGQGLVPLPCGPEIPLGPR